MNISLRYSSLTLYFDSIPYRATYQQRCLSLPKDTWVVKKLLPSKIFWRYPEALYCEIISSGKATFHVKLISCDFRWRQCLDFFLSFEKFWGRIKFVLFCVLVLPLCHVWSKLWWHWTRPLARPHPSSWRTRVQGRSWQYPSGWPWFRAQVCSLTHFVCF